MTTAYAVYPDSRRLDLSDTNVCMAVFILLHHAETYALAMWGNNYHIEEIVITDWPEQLGGRIK